MKYEIDPNVEKSLSVSDDGYFHCPAGGCFVKNKRKGNLVKHIADQHPDVGGYFTLRMNREAFGGMLGGFLSWANTGNPIPLSMDA